MSETYDPGLNPVLVQELTNGFVSGYNQTIAYSFHATSEDFAES